MQERPGLASRADLHTCCGNIKHDSDDNDSNDPDSRQRKQDEREKTRSWEPLYAGSSPGSQVEVTCKAVDVLPLARQHDIKVWQRPHLLPGQSLQQVLVKVGQLEQRNCAF